jgi:hypothetical protein
VEAAKKTGSEMTAKEMSSSVRARFVLSRPGHCHRRTVLIEWGGPGVTYRNREVVLHSS